MRRSRHRRQLALLPLLLSLLVAACGGPTTALRPTSATASGVGSKAALSGPVTVLAAASLTDAFTTLAHDFERAHPGVQVRLSFGGSSTLAQQVLAGAPADVLATASPQTMQQVGGRARTPVDIAVNTLEIATPPGNPAGVDGLAALARPGVRVAICAPQVPCGAVSEATLAAAGVTLHPVTLERDVKAVLTKVRLGEVDAGLVYATDVRSAGDAVHGVPLPVTPQARTRYPIAVLAAAPHPAAAQAFVELVRSPTGAAVLAAAGFGPP